MRIDVRGLTFDVRAGGPADGDPVLLLHGFPQDSREWDGITGGLHDAGLRTFALDQRGYSPGARPAGSAAYRMAETVADAVAVLDALGLPDAHVVGHDWGAVVAWHVAARHPDRVRTLTAVSVPHPLAYATSVKKDPAQAVRSAYMLFFRTPWLPEKVLSARGGALLRRIAGGNPTLPPDSLTGALNWYRSASGHDLKGIGPVTVPTTYVWSDRDVAISGHAARRCAAHVTGDYRFVTLEGVSHWIPDEAPDRLLDAVLARVSPRRPR
ncbi:alpha/beta fold hydrolase [Dactylosporangium aurantiacum]|uniref:Alpha/beta fold hydrolase n=1 Tax=Dactylosporangium aurantiacum TaxID=35754 RepID=A0A9Q9I990_9ACTN|nr:alpha/beta fold hydrolase [Dactylosporangium aurantiacum]MDG6108872.1 alpha/beta fold hydrolase [Dactylosporangium aurantiacum]UWZ52169.1 alpha/beta fold hydrolase [Dactylosporangium aurantiacum]